jgi:menaquinone-dependent protoporphyrinogen IX oxidase
VPRRRGSTARVSLGGALRHPEYGFLTPSLVTFVAGRETGDTDASRDSESADRDEVRRFGREFGAFVDDRLARRSKGDPEGEP